MGVLVGITCNVDWGKGTYYLEESYVEAVQACGATPLLLPAVAQHTIKDYLDLVDAVVFTGGGDVDPLYFGEEPVSSQRITPTRDAFEISLARELLKAQKPVLGICRGMQVLNIAAGGDIFQDLSLQDNGGRVIQHRQNAPGWYPTHWIEVRQGSLLAHIWGQARVRVNSFHHQAIRSLAPGFKAVAVASDGVVEAMEREGNGFVLGVQWHPELMWAKDTYQRQLFASLVKAAAQKTGVKSIS